MSVQLPVKTSIFELGMSLGVLKMCLEIFVFLYVITTIGLVLGLLVNGMRPTKTHGWLLAIFTIPVGGILLYVVLGRNRRKNKFLGLKKTEEITAYLKTND